VKKSDTTAEYYTEYYSLTATTLKSLNSGTGVKTRQGSISDQRSAHCAGGESIAGAILSHRLRRLLHSGGDFVMG